MHLFLEKKNRSAEAIYATVSKSFMGGVVLHYLQLQFNKSSNPPPPAKQKKKQPGNSAGDLFRNV